MSYTPTTWSSGDLITSTKLNKIEQGLASISDLDSTLGTAGKAADSKAVGDEVTELKNDLTAAENDIEAAQDEIETLKDTAYIVNSAEGDIAVFGDGAATDAKSVVINIEPVQAAGVPSPDNVRPITGRTSATVTRTGKNLLKPQMAQGTSSNVIFGQSDTTSFGTFLKAGTYTVSVQSSKSFAFYYRVENGTKNVHIGNYNVTSATFTITEDLKLQLYAYLGAGLSVSDISNPQLELGSTATAYEPYTGTTIPVSWETEAGTVYGAELDVVSGKLTVAGYFTTLQGATLYRDNDTYKIYMITKPASVSMSGGKYARCNITNQFGYVNSSILETKIQAPTTSNARVIASLPADIAPENVEMCYELATPQTYQLTPQQIQTLLGENVIYSDAGSVSVDYRADAKLYIEQLTKPTEDDMTANTAIQNGKFFMVGNRLFLSTTAIASGDTINPGTNCTELSLADALNNLN